MKTLTNNNAIAPKKGRMAKVTVIAWRAHRKVVLSKLFF